MKHKAVYAKLIKMILAVVMFIGISAFQDRIHFNAVGNEVINIHEGEGGVASNGLRWGLSMTSYQGGAGLQRFIIQYD
jgi:hypothetical protein